MLNDTVVQNTDQMNYLCCHPTYECRCSLWSVLEIWGIVAQNTHIIIIHFIAVSIDQDAIISVKIIASNPNECT